ncbi:hypothetical protein TD95_002214, partial [Thielaviopsis punctulata]
KNKVYHGFIMSMNSRQQRLPSRNSQRSRGRTNDMRDFATAPPPKIPKDFEPCAATSSMFLYAHGTSIICCRHNSLEIERRFTRHNEEVQLLAVDNCSPQGAGRLVVSYDASQIAIVWDLSTGNEVARFECYDHPTTVTWMRNGNIAFGNTQGHIIQFEPGTEEHISTITLSQIPITALAVANDNVTFAIGYSNGTLLVANVTERFHILHTLTSNRTPSPIVTLQWHSSTPQQKSTMLAAQTRDGDLRVWSVPKSAHGGSPIAVRILSKNDKGEESVPGPNWMAWSKNGRIIQYSQNETLSWDVRTRHVTRDVIPTVGEVNGIAIYGAGACLFTLGANNTVQQFDLNAPSVLVKNVQHPAHVLPPSPPVSIEEAEKAMGMVVASSSESEIPFNPSDVTESEEDQEGYISNGASMERGYTDGESTSFLSSQGGEQPSDMGSKTVSIPGYGKVRSRGGKSDHTYISTGSRAQGLSAHNSARYTPQQQRGHDSRIHDFQSQSSLNTASTRPRMRAGSRQTSTPTMDSSSTGHIDIFKFTRTRLDDIPHKHMPISDKMHLTNDDLRRQMLNTIFGWKGEVEELILDEMTRHPRGSSVKIMLSKWIDQPINEDDIMDSTDLMSSSDWMLLALSGIGTQPSQQKLGRAYITKLLEQRDLHAAVTIMLGMGDYNDAIEVYISHKHYLEALILTCLYCPTVWERQCAIVKKWGEWAVQHGHQKLAIRCFACTERESTEPWASPSAAQLTFQSLGPDIFSPPLSPPSAKGPQRSIAKSSALKLITSFGEQGQKSKFFSEDYDDSKTPVPGGVNTAGLHQPPGQDDDPTTAILRPSNRSAFNTPTSTRSYASGTSGYSRKRLPSIGELPSDVKKLEPVNRQATRTQAPPEADNTSSLSTGLTLSRAATASPMMMRDNYRRLTHEQPLPSPGLSMSQKMEMLNNRNASRNASRDRVNRLQLNIDTARAMDENEQPAVSSARYHWPRRRGPASVSSVTSASTSRSHRNANKPSLDGPVNSIDAATDYRRHMRRQSSRERGRGGSRDRGVGREPSLDRGRSAVAVNYPAKRSPTSPVPMSPEDIVSLKVKSTASIDAASSSRKANNSSRASNRSARSRSRARGMAERGIPLTINTTNILSQIESNRRGIKSPTSPAPMSALIPDLSGSEDEQDYQLALADQDKFRQARSASRNQNRKTPDPIKQTEKQQEQQEQQQQRVPSPNMTRMGASSRPGSHEHAGDLRRIREDRQRKKELAARELEERRRELANNAQAGPIIHPNDIPTDQFSRPSTANEMMASQYYDMGRSATADPYNGSSKSRQQASFGLPATPKAMRLVHDSLEFKAQQPLMPHMPEQFLPATSFSNDKKQQQQQQQQQQQKQNTPPPPPSQQDLQLLPATTFFSGSQQSGGPSALNIDNDVEIAPAPATAALPSMLQTGGLTLLPSTVYQPPSKAIPRCQSAPIPDEPSFTRSRSVRHQNRPRQDSQTSRYDRDMSPAPPVLKELRHLVAPKTSMNDMKKSQATPPPPPPPPPPSGHLPAVPTGALAAGMIEIVKDDDKPKPVLGGYDAPMTVPPSDFMVPVLPPPAPPLKGHSRGRSIADSAPLAPSQQQQQSSGSIAGRFSKATERLRSASRSRKDNPSRSAPLSPQDGQVPPYESVVIPTSYHRQQSQQQQQQQQQQSQQQQQQQVPMDLDSLPTGLSQNEFI